MKRLVFLSLLAAARLSHAQIEFQTGYFIENDGKRVECQIRNSEWLYNPTKIRYRFGDNEQPLETDISRISEFGVAGARYLRTTVDVDQSPSDVRKLDDNRQPIWKNETVFLKLLVAGKASLYHYNTTSFERFFYSVDDKPIQQLVYKEFIVVVKRSPHDIGASTQLRINGTYMNQLSTDVSCGQKKQNKQLKFNKATLVKYFSDYNTCSGSPFIDLEGPKKKTDLRVFVSPGVSLPSMKMTDFYPFRRVYQFHSAPTFRFGFELEFMMGFNNNKWSTFIEPNFQSYKSTTEGSGKTELVYSSLELPAGLRHHFFLAQRKRITLAAGIAIDRPLELRVKSSNFNDVTSTIMKAKAFAAIGIELKKLRIEGRYYTPRKSMDEFEEFSFEYNNMSIIAAYRIL